MALIEYLERDDWADVLRRSFEVAIALLQTDRFGLTSSAVDDVRGGLASGGVSRVRLHLNRQMKNCRFTADRQREEDSSETSPFEIWMFSKGYSQETIDVMAQKSIDGSSRKGYACLHESSPHRGLD